MRGKPATGLPAKHKVSDEVDHGVSGIVLEEYRDQLEVPLTFAQGPQIRLERPLQLRKEDSLCFGTRMVQLKIFLAMVDSSNFMLDNHSLNYCKQRGTVGGSMKVWAEA
jgi:hypothetical protein